MTIYPRFNGTGAIKFNIKLFGCPTQSTQGVAYVFHSTKTAVETAYSAISFFENEIASIVVHETGIDPRRFLTNAVPDLNGNLTVTLTVLPDYNKTNTQSVDDIVRILSTQDSLIRHLKSVQGWVIDHDAELCIGKVCPVDSICLNGKCASRFEGIAGNASSISTVNDAGYRRLVASTGILTTYSFTLSGSNRFIIPIVIIGVTLLVIAGIAVLQYYKHYQRLRLETLL